MVLLVWNACVHPFLYRFVVSQLFGSFVFGNNPGRIWILFANGSVVLVSLLCQLTSFLLDRSNNRGGGMYGKLGHGNEVGHSTPKRVDVLVGLAVSHIACGSRHTAIITSSGAIYTWGDKENGVTGHGDTDGHQYTPKLLERLAGKRCVCPVFLFFGFFSFLDCGAGVLVRYRVRGAS